MKLGKKPVKIITSDSSRIESTRYIEQFNILITGLWANRNITIWNVADLNDINKATTQYGIIRVEIINQ